MNKKKDRYPVLIAAMVLVVLAAGTATASTVTQGITYQGKLTDAAGNPLTGSYSVRFSLYNVSTGGTPFASSTQVISSTNGLFTTQVTFNPLYFSGQELWLGIKVGTDPEMTPRQQVRPVPYALGLRPGALVTGTGTTPALLLKNSGGGTALNATTLADDSPGVFGQTQGEDSDGFSAFTLGKNSEGFVATTFGQYAKGFSATTHGEGASGVLAITDGPSSNAFVALTTAGSSQGVAVLTAGDKSGGVSASTFGDSSTGISASTLGFQSHAVKAKTSTSQSHGVHVETSGKYSDGVNISTTGSEGHGVAVSTSGEESYGVTVKTGSDDSYAFYARTEGVHSNGFSASTYGVQAYGVSSFTHGDQSSGIIAETYGDESDGIRLHTRGADAEGIVVAADGSRSDGIIANSTHETLSGYGILAYSETSSGIWAETGRGSNKYGVQTPDIIRALGYETGASDVAEYLPVAADVEPGTVLVIGPDGVLTPSASAYDTGVAGIVSTVPGISLGAEEEGNPGEALVAIAGRVPCRVDASNGPVHPRDLLTTSDRPGYAMKAEPVTIDGIEFYRPGTVIGKAMGALESGTGTIEVLVALQ